MAKPQRLHNEPQEEFAERFNAVARTHNRWTVWCDAMTIFAAVISNTVDTVHRDQREQLYTGTASRYSKRELDNIAHMFGLVAAALEENPDQDFLGNLYMRLELGNKDNGQFFTPYSLCQLNAKLQCSIKETVAAEHWATVNDPACGAGALLIAFANECKAQGVNYQQSVLFAAQDIDTVTASMCYVQLSLLGCPGYVVVGDTLAHPATSYDRRGLIPVDGGNVWYTPMYFADTWEGRRVAWRVDNMVFRRGKSKPEPIRQPAQKLEVTSSGQLSLF